MFAIVQVGSSQFKVTKGDVIHVDLQDSEEGKSINLDQVVMYQNDGDVRVGQPYLKDVKVKASVVKHTQGAKTAAFKYRKRKHSSKFIGHRQQLTELSIVEIQAS